MKSIGSGVILLENWSPFRSGFGGVGHVEVNQVVENLHVSHLDPCLLLDEVFDFVDSIIHGDGDSFVALWDFHCWPFSGAAAMPFISSAAVKTAWTISCSGRVSHEP